MASEIHHGEHPRSRSQAIRCAARQEDSAKNLQTDYTAGFTDKKAAEEHALEDVSELAAAQDLLWASKEYALIIIFQALDAAGKDGTIKHVMSGVNPQGVNVHSFKAPTDEERLHHFLWRPMRVLPARGMIAIFNRSYYEEVLVVRVHPEFLESQWLPRELAKRTSSNSGKRATTKSTRSRKPVHNRTSLMLKFFLNVSARSSGNRFLERLDDPEKNWKFSAADVRERGFWDEYQAGLRGHAQRHQHRSGALARHPGRQEMVHPGLRGRHHHHPHRELNLKYPPSAKRSSPRSPEPAASMENEANDDHKVAPP